MPDLSIGADLDSAKPLKANEGLSNRGMQLYRAGFILEEEEVERILLVEPASKAVIKVYLNGKDFTGNSRGVKVIDFFSLSEHEALVRYPLAYQRVLERIKPERDLSKEASVKKKWWLHGRTRDDLRAALTPINRYIATVETAKHRTFQFLDAEILPDNMLVAIALDDSYHLGILSSNIHITWALAAGGTLENRPRYNKSRCFDPFPFPDATTGVSLGGVNCAKICVKMESDSIFYIIVQKWSLIPFLQKSEPTVMIQRAIEPQAQHALSQFRALCLTGPRQSGKTTLSQYLFANKPHVSFENPSVQFEAEQNPEAFLAQFKQGAILDEVQRMPDLFRYLQGILDSNRQRGSSF